MCSSDLQMAMVAAGSNDVTDVGVLSATDRDTVTVVDLSTFPALGLDVGVDQIDVLVGRCHYRGGIAGRVVLEPFVGEVVEMLDECPGSDPIVFLVDVEGLRVAVAE